MIWFLQTLLIFSQTTVFPFKTDKHKSKIEDKERSKTEYYFEVKLKANFSEDISIENNPDIKKWMKEYKDEYELESVNYLPVLTLAENVF